jgi:hypothetical protein
VCTCQSRHGTACSQSRDKCEMQEDSAVKYRWIRHANTYWQTITVPNHNKHHSMYQLFSESVNCLCISFTMYYHQSYVEWNLCEYSFIHVKDKMGNDHMSPTKRMPWSSSMKKDILCSYTNQNKLKEENRMNKTLRTQEWRCAQLWCKWW